MLGSVEKRVGGRVEHIPGDTTLFGAEEMFQHFYCMHMHAHKTFLLSLSDNVLTLNLQEVKKHTNTLSDSKHPHT